MDMTAHTHNGITFHTADSFVAAGGVAHAFSTRTGGVSAPPWNSLNLSTTRGDEPEHVRENYRRLTAAAGVALARLVKAKQVHGDTVRVVTEADLRGDIYDPEGYEADGLVTDVPNLSLMVFTADCVPTLLYDPVRRVVGAVHAGWRGTALSVAGKAAARMQTQYGCKPCDILAAIGPCISRCCFETHGEVPQAMTEQFGADAAPYMQPLEEEKFKVDLKGLNALSLRLAGVEGEHITISGDCTACNPERYWSHRLTGEARGAQASVICLI